MSDSLHTDKVRIINGTVHAVCNDCDWEARTTDNAAFQDAREHVASTKHRVGVSQRYRYVYNEGA